MNSTHFTLTLTLFLLSLSLTIPLLPSAVADDKSTLRALHSAFYGRWNLTGTDHCRWQGVVCNSDKRVFELHLPGVGLVGPIPPGIIGNLTALNFLSLRFNALTGSIPSDFSSLTQLQSLYLQGNKLSGQIPSVLLGLPNLLRLNLAGNNFSGAIPSGVNNLTKLSTLFLENNTLTGGVPDLNLPNLQQFNVSNNFLNGSVPGDLCTKFPSSAFDGNSLTACPQKPPTSSDGGASGGKKKKLSAGAIAGIVIAGVVVLLAILLLVFFCCCRRKKEEHATRPNSAAVVAGPADKSDVEMAAPAPENKVRNGTANLAAAAPPATKTSASKSGGGIEKTLVFFGNTPRVFDLDDLLRASAEVLGKGNYGTTYKASLENGVAMAIKRLKDVTVGEKEFRDQMEEIGRFEHENLVGLRAYHCSANEKLLVYDYLPMGSLSALLHGNRGSGRTPLNWETRSAIAMGAAHGIAFIHSQSPTSSHGNIKSSNILLTTSYEARVSDLGLAQLATSTASSNRVAGYRAPEVTDLRKVSQKADVYSFGVLILELLTGKAPAHALLNEEGVDLPRWVQSVVREEWAAEVFDLDLLRHQSFEEGMVQLLQLGLDCTAQHPDKRPSMAQITSCIEEICGSISVSGPDHDDVTSSDPKKDS